MSLTDVQDKSIEEIASGLLVSAEGEQPDPHQSDDAQAELDLGVPDEESAIDAQEQEAYQDDPADDVDSEEEPDSEIDDQEAEEIVDLYTVKVDGVERQVTLDELQRGYSGQQYIQAQMHEAAKLRKAAEERIAEAARMRDAYAEQLAQVQAQPADLPEPDPALYETDPVEWARQRELWRTAREQRDRQQAELAELNAQRQHEYQAARQHRLQQELAKLVEFDPDFSDAQKAQAKRQRYIDLAGKFGYSAEEVGAVDDHRVFRLLNRLDELESAAAGAPKAVQKARKARPTIRPGAAKRGKTDSQKRQNALVQRAKRTGHVDDIAALLLEPRGG